jgi:hypothetical protein
MTDSITFPFCIQKHVCKKDKNFRALNPLGKLESMDESRALRAPGGLLQIAQQTTDR